MKKVTIFSKIKKKCSEKSGWDLSVGLFLHVTAPFNAWRNRRQLGSPACFRLQSVVIVHIT